jgi:hypothetical protein
MSALTDGFNSAFSAMQSHYDRQENNERYDQSQNRQSALDIKADERYNAQVVRQSGLDDRAAKLQDIQMTNQGLQQTVNQEAVNQIPINNARKTKQYDQGQVQYEQSQKQIANQQAGEELRAMVASGTAGTAIYDPKYDNTNLALLRDGGGKFAKSIVEKWNSGDFAGSIPEMNKLFKTQLSKGSGDGIKSKSIASVKMVKDENGEDALEVLLNVTPTKGAPYTASLTKFRSSNPDDPISQVKLGDLFDTVGGLSEFSSFMDQSGATGKTGQNANNYLSQGQTPAKPNFQEITGTDEFGNKITTGFFDPVSQIFRTPNQQEQKQIAEITDTPEQKAAKSEIANKKVNDGVVQELLTKYNATPENAQTFARVAMMEIAKNKKAGVRPDIDSIVAQAYEEGMKGIATNDAASKQSAIDTKATVNLGRNITSTRY